MNLRPYKKIRELESDIERLKSENRMYAKQEEERKFRENAGMHKTGSECLGCKYHINTGYEFLCIKDCKCEDREECK